MPPDSLYGLGRAGIMPVRHGRDTSLEVLRAKPRGRLAYYRIVVRMVLTNSLTCSGMKGEDLRQCRGRERGMTRVVGTRMRTKTGERVGWGWRVSTTIINMGVGMGMSMRLSLGERDGSW